MQSFLRFIDQKKISIITLVFLDLLFFVVSFIFSYYLRNAIGEPIQPIGVYIQALPVSFFILVVIFYFFGLYEQKIRISGFSEAYTVTKALLMTSILIMAGSFLYKYDYSRGYVLIFIVSSIIFINFGRFLLRIIRQSLIQKGVGLKKVLIVGSGSKAHALANKLKQYKSFGYLIEGFAKPENLAEVINKKKIDVVFVSDQSIPNEKILEMMTESEHLPVKFKIVTGLYEILAGNLDMNEIEGIPAIDVKPKKPNALYLFFKRFIDVIFSLIGLIILFPLWILIVILIRIDSPGRAVFTHERVGLNGEIFKLYKFRTMKKEVGEYEEAPIKKEDKRITRIGKFLRKTSLDELPQLINVLLDDMSLVGPRPEMPFIVKKYSKWQRKRLQAKPGLTGLWQILGRKDLPLHENIEYDFYYIQNQSFLLDLIIMVKTIWTVITGKGAF